MTDHEDPFEARLRRALREEADTIRPGGDGLARIRHSMQRRRRIWWRRPALTVGTAAAVLGVVTGVAVGVLGNGGQVAAPVVPAATGTTTGSPTESRASTASPEPSRGTPTSRPTSPTSPTGEPTSATHEPTTRPSGPSPSTARGGTPTHGSAPGGEIAVPVYYLGGDAGQPRLYREYHRLHDTGGPGPLAVTELLRGRPTDPDYFSQWPAGTRLLGYTVEGGVASVDLSRAALARSARAAVVDASVQQLVYTVTAADRRAQRVRLLVAGEPVDQLWGQPVAQQPIARAPMLEVQGLIWVLDPTQGARTASPVRVRVFGTAFEGTVTLDVLRGSTTVASTFVTTAGDAFREATTTIELPAGDYTLRAYDANTAPGAAPAAGDSKDFTVR